MQDKKQIGLIVTAVTVFLCGCPGLCVMAFGGMLAGGGSFPSEYVDTTGNPILFGSVFLCIGFLMVLIPLGSGVFTFLQSKKEKENEVADIEEVPPAI